MNCQDIARILNEQEVDRLPGTDLSAAHAHLAGCGDCARDWKIHAQLSAIAIPAVPAELRALYVTQMAGVADLRARRRSQLFFIGTLAAVAAAASMLIVQLTGSRTPDAAQMVSPQVESVGAPASGAALASMEASMPAEAEEQPASMTDRNSGVATADPPRLRLMLLPPRHDSTDMAAKPAIEAFHAALLQALRNLPDVMVELSSGAGVAGDQSGNRVTVVSPRVTTLTSGQHIYHSADGRSSWSGGGLMRDGRQQWAVEVMLQPAIQRDPGGVSAVRLAVDSNGIPTGQSCGTQGLAFNRVIVNNAGDTAEFRALIDMCSSAEKLVAPLIATLRPMAEPPVSNPDELTSRLSDASSPANDRRTAFSELLRRGRQGNMTLNAAELDAISAYVGSLSPERRAESWLMLRGVRQPGLVVPLLQSLQQDDEQKVRLEAMATLVADYASDSRVRAALESAAQEDVSRFVRMAAQRVIVGEGPWQAFVTETLANAGLPASERVAPALYDARYISDPDGVEGMRAYLGSPDITGQLLDIFHELAAELRKSAQGRLPSSFQRQESQQEDVMQNVLNLLSITNPPAAIDLQLSILTEGNQPDSRLTSQALYSLLEKRDDPRVQSVLDDIAAGKEGPGLQHDLERLMAMRPQPTPQDPPTPGGSE